MKNKKILEDILKDFEDFSQMKKIDYPPIYMLGGSGAILTGYLDRSTLDIDILDLEYNASVGRILKVLGVYDLLDIHLTTIPTTFKERAVKVEGYTNIYVLSREDIILSKIGRYSQKDIDDISILIEDSDVGLLLSLIEKVLSRRDISIKVLDEFRANVKRFKDDFDV